MSLKEVSDWTFAGFFLAEYADAVRYTPPHDDRQIDHIYTRRKGLKKISVWWTARKKPEPFYVYEGRIFKTKAEDYPGTSSNAYLWFYGYLASPLHDYMMIYNANLWARKPEKKFNQQSAKYFLGRMHVLVTENGPYGDYNNPDTHDGDGVWLTHRCKQKDER